jgi:CheY-like chemotaxis protein
MYKNPHSNINILSEISHEIRTPLTGILGMVHFLNQSNLNKEQKSYVKFIIKAANELENADKKIKVILSKYISFCSPTNLKKPKILLVEDNPIILKIHKAIIEKSIDETIEIAERGDEAVLKVAKTNYDLIFMDIGLPGINGFEATKQIRDLKNSKATIIGLTAYSLPEVEERCLNAGMDMVINKPTIPGQLEELIQGCAERINNGCSAHEKFVSANYSASIV